MDEENVRNAGRAIASGEPLRALTLVGRTDTAIGLTIRGIAYAQMGELDLAKTSLERALRIGASKSKAEDRQTLARARAALVEIMLGAGDDPAEAARLAKASADDLAKLGDLRNAAMQRLVLARAEILRGQLGEARHVVSSVLASAPADVVAVAHLALAEIEIRSLGATAARGALTLARKALEDAPHRLLARALVALEEELSRPIARLLIGGGSIRDADLFAIEDAARGQHLLVDACRLLVLGGRVTIPLARRPVLFALLLVLARAWPASVPRDELAAQAFDVKKISAVNASHRSRLRVEIGRLRKVLADGLDAEPTATADGYVLTTKRDVIVLLPPSDDDAARLLLLLGDGAAWSAKSLAEHAGVSARTAQRALAVLVEKGTAIRMGQGSSARYVRPGTPIASRMLLLGLLPKT